MNVFDLLGNKMVEPVRYIPPCESGIFNEHGTPVGYYVDALGREFPQEMVNGFEMGPGQSRDGCGDVIDVTFEEVTE